MAVAVAGAGKGNDDGGMDPGYLEQKLHYSEDGTKLLDAEGERRGFNQSVHEL